MHDRAVTRCKEHVESIRGPSHSDWRTVGFNATEIVPSGVPYAIDISQVVQKVIFAESEQIKTLGSPRNKGGGSVKFDDMLGVDNA